MQPILSALSSGYRTSTILNHLKRQFPQYRQQIEAAEIAGYSANSIIKSLTQDAPAKEKDKYQVLTENEQTRLNDEKNRSNALKGTLAAGALAAGGIYGLHRLATAGRAIQ